MSTQNEASPPRLSAAARHMKGLQVCDGQRMERIEEESAGWNDFALRDRLCSGGRSRGVDVVWRWEFVRINSRLHYWRQGLGAESRDTEYRVRG